MEKNTNEVLQATSRLEVVEKKIDEVLQAISRLEVDIAEWENQNQ
jgi:hypothetical protein